MPPGRREVGTPALDALSGTEHAKVLAKLLISHPDLRPEAELAARRLLDMATVECIADEVVWALRDIPLEDLAGRVGPIRGRGYVNENEAAWELLGEVIESFLTDLRRRAGLRLVSAATVAIGIVAGLYQARNSEDGTVVAYAGEDALTELADEVFNETTRLGVAIPVEAAEAHWPQWASLS
ncbi:MAG: hypothetical protein ACC682_16970 [Gemmatimonadota bacterium]